jgi:hypothetical protein
MAPSSMGTDVISLRAATNAARPRSESERFAVFMIEENLGTIYYKCKMNPIFLNPSNG